MEFFICKDLIFLQNRNNDFFYVDFYANLYFYKQNWRNTT